MRNQEIEEYESEIGTAGASALKRYFEHRALHVAGLLFVVFVLATPAYQNLGQYSDFYDGGVYLESARMVASGYAPYRAVFFPHLLLPASSCSRRSAAGGSQVVLSSNGFWRSGVLRPLIWLSQ